MSTLVIRRWDVEQDGSPSEAKLRALLEARGYSVAHYTYSPGTRFPPHVHGEAKIDVVLEGRDIGTVVFPDADHKFFLIADIHERAKRRMQEMEAKGEIVSLSVLTAELEERDRTDSTREHSPLKKAEDAIELDTTGLSIEQQVNRIVEIVTKSIK